MNQSMPLHLLCVPCKIACHPTGPSGQTLTQQTWSPSGEVNGSRLRC